MQFNGAFFKWESDLKISHEARAWSLNEFTARVLRTGGIWLCNPYSF